MMQYWHDTKIRLVSVLLTCLVMGCSKPSTTAQQKILTISKKSASSSLFYAGVVQPRQTMVVSSPADGTIVNMPLQYGEKVKAGQLLFSLSSGKFLTDYKNALTAFVKAKSQFNNSDIQLKEAAFLHKNELISDDEYKTKQANYYGAQLELLQAKDSLDNLINQLDIKNLDLNHLSIMNIEKITAAMHLKTLSENLQIFAPADGVLLAINKSEDENKKMQLGDAIKQGDALAVIGDMSGLTVRIKVNELTINQLKIGQKVLVTGIAFPEENLLGEILRIDKQAETTSGGLPTFSVMVKVAQLTKHQQHLIHVGMSAKVEIKLDQDELIMVPIAAVMDDNGKTSVELYDKATQTTRRVAVVTGKTTPDAVSILSGLKVGDQIIVKDMN